MSVPETFLWILPPIIRDYLWTDENFRDIMIVTEDMENVSDQVGQALAGILKGPTDKSGLSIIIHSTRHGGGIANTPAAFNLEAALTFSVAEIPVINRNTDTGGTGLPGIVVAELIVSLMKKFQSPEIVTHFWEPDKAIAAPRYDPDTGLIMHVVTMHCHGGIEDITEVVATPAITEVHGTVTISCATTDADLFYTIDGTRPNKDYSETTEDYSIPFATATPPVTVKARAYKTGMRASLIATLVTD